MKVESFKRFSLETLRCGARAFPVGMATRLIGHFYIYSAHMRMWSTWLTAILFSFGRDVLCEYWSSCSGVIGSKYTSI